MNEKGDFCAELILFIFRKGSEKLSFLLFSKKMKIWFLRKTQGSIVARISVYEAL